MHTHPPRTATHPPRLSTCPPLQPYCRLLLRPERESEARGGGLTAHAPMACLPLRRMLVGVGLVAQVTATSGAAAGGAGSGTTYYVSPTGSDSAPGATAARAWQTLGAASHRLRSGDTLLLERGGRWLDQRLNTSAGNLTVGSYGPATAPAPLIQHGRPLGSGPYSHACLNFLAADGLTVSDLHLSGCSGGMQLAGPPRRGALPALGKHANDVLIQRMFWNDIRTPFLLYNPASPRWAAALSLSGSFKNLTVQNCVAVRIDVFFDSRAFIDGMHLDSNTVQQCSGNCYSLGSGVDLLMQDSVFLRDMSTRLFMYGTTDIIVGSLTGTTNKVINTDFNARGEYQVCAGGRILLPFESCADDSALGMQGGPDGCAFGE
jgi:hypothetical protein